jgi:protocatechuate 3,4-dioxygenase beta subunit
MRFAKRSLPVFLLMLMPLALPAGDASVSGVVVNDSTGKPVHMAMVTLATTGSKPMEASVYTDTNGMFRFDAVPPGRYYLRAGEFRYQTVAFGAPTPDRYPAVLTLGGGEIRQGIELRMRPLGAISGVVFDQDGDPLPRVNVQLMAPAWARGRKTWIYRNGAASNERGEFRLHGIAPGHYLIAASAQGAPALATHPQVTFGESEPDLIFGKVFYPNATRIQEARPMEVKPGADVRDLVLQMTTTPAAVVTGHVELPDGLNAPGRIQVSFVPEDEGVFRSTMNTVAGNQFVMPGLAPGHYTAITSVRGADEYRGLDEVDLQPGPQEVALHLEKGVRLAGKLEVQGPGGGDLTQYRIHLIPGDMLQARRNQLSAPVDKDGAFAFAAVTAGVWDIGVQPMPKGGYVKSMKLGEQDVLTEDMTITAGTSAPLRVVLSTRGGVVSGMVKTPEDGTRPVVLLTPVGKFSRVESFQTMRPADEAGKYEITGITPGSYKVFAFERLDRNAARDPDFATRIDSLGKPVEVHEGEQVRLDLDLLPAPPATDEPGGEQ